MPITAESSTQDLTIQQMSRQCGLSEHTLRFYEKVGLIPSVPRDGSSTHRRYPPDLVLLVEAIACLQQSGLSIQDMRDYLALIGEGASAAYKQKVLLEAHDKALEKEIERLKLRRRYLRGKMAYWDAVVEGDAEKIQAVTEANHRIGAQLMKIQR
ncbi:MerR family transcriptional regulator [bacterium]|nr:MAG: MerR family transcriptional regulator [bacterium]